MNNSLKIERRVRWYQRPFHEYLVNTPAARAIEVAHRRWGKDEIVLAATCELAHKRIASYWHCLPEYAQGRKALWTAVNAQTGKFRIDEAFPPEIRETKNDQEMFIRLKCGSTWQIIGSDRYDGTVGAGVAGIAYSEWALANPSAWAYHRPMLEENNGWAAFITTPRGRNHAHAMYNMARDNPRWFAEVSSIHETKALSSDQLEESLKEYIALYGEDLGRAQFEQEYYCSFEAAILGAYWGKEISAAERDGRITKVEADEHAPVHTVWDLGVGDATAIWWFQIIGPEVHVLDFYEAHGMGVGHYAEIVKRKAKDFDFQRGHDYVPHDAKQRVFTDTNKKTGKARQRIEVMIDEGLKPRLVPMHRVMDGISAARQTLPRCYFDAVRCEAGLERLRQYRADWDDNKKCFRDAPYHDWTSHGADAFRYLAMAWRMEAPAPEDKPAGRNVHEATLEDMWKHKEQTSSETRI